jgi:hypothetical protein
MKLQTSDSLSGLLWRFANKTKAPLLPIYIITWQHAVDCVAPTETNQFPGRNTSNAAKTGGAYIRPKDVFLSSTHVQKLPGKDSNLE